jgi:hypothetical protein
MGTLQRDHNSEVYDDETGDLIEVDGKDAP